MTTSAGRVVTCILNPHSGSQQAEQVQELAPRIAAEYGAEARVLLARDPSEMKAMADHARNDSDVVAAGGGDGTINCVAATLVGGEAALGVLPLGTLNHFAKDLGIPLDLEQALRTLFSGTIAPIDVADVNGHVFVNNSSIGFFPEMVRERERRQRDGHPKLFAFIQAVMLVVSRGRTLHAEMRNEGERIEVHATTFLFVGNNRYELTGLELGKRAALDRGTLWVCAAPHAGHLALARRAILGLLKRGGADEFTTFETNELVVRTGRRRADVSRDGEVSAMDMPLHYRIHRGGLNVVRPAEA